MSNGRRTCAAGIAMLLACALALPAPAPAAEPPGTAGLAALVGSRPVTLRDLAARLALRGIEPANASAADWKTALEDAVNHAVLVDAARGEKIEVSDEQARAAVAERARGPRGEAYRRLIRAAGFTEAQELEYARESLMIGRFFVLKAGAALTVSPQAVRAWYDKNKDLLATGETREARVITVRVPAADGPAGEAARAAARETLDGIRELAVRGADFAELARTRSADPWAAKGGLLDPMVEAESGSIFAPRVFRLKQPGDVSEAFETEAGLHLLRLEKVVPPVVPTFEQAQDAVRQRLLDELSEKVLAGIADELRRKSAVRIFWTNLPR